MKKELISIDKNAHGAYVFNYLIGGEKTGHYKRFQIYADNKREAKEMAKEMLADYLSQFVVENI